MPSNFFEKALEHFVEYRSTMPALVTTQNFVACGCWDIVLKRILVA